jgi:hypothetical protein
MASAREPYGLAIEKCLQRMDVVAEGLDIHTAAASADVETDRQSISTPDASDNCSQFFGGFVESLDFVQGQ